MMRMSKHPSLCYRTETAQHVSSSGCVDMWSQCYTGLLSTMSYGVFVSWPCCFGQGIALNA